MERLRVPKAVPQMQDMPGPGQLHGAGHIVHIAVGIGENEEFHRRVPF